jgi:hypothetical protein
MHSDATDCIHDVRKASTAAVMWDTPSRMAPAQELVLRKLACKLSTKKHDSNRELMDFQGSHK